MTPHQENIKILLRFIETGPCTQERDELLKHGGEQIRCQSEVGLAECDSVSRIVAMTRTIRQFAKLIRTKYGVPKKSELYLDDTLVLLDEPMQILRDKDTVRIVTAAQQPSNSDSHPDNDPESSLGIDTLIKEIKWEGPEIGEPIKEEVIKTEVKRERSKLGECIKTEVNQEPPESHDTPVVEVDNVSGMATPIPLSQRPSRM